MEITEEMHETITACPGLAELVTALLQTKFKDDADAALVVEAVGSFMAAVRDGKVYRPEFLH